MATLALRRPFTQARLPSSSRDVQGGWNETPPQTKSSSNSIMNCFQHTPLHGMGSPGAGPRRVAQARDRAPPPLNKLGKPFVQQPSGDTRVTPEDKQRLAEQRAAEIAKRRADFNATNN